MKERLTDLLKKADESAKSKIITDYNEAVADNAEFLLANGVIVPPCKVGDTVYFPMETDGECEPYVDVGKVFAIGIDEGYTMWISVRYEGGLRYYHTSGEFGKSVFLTREEAEKALAEKRACDA